MKKALTLVMALLIVLSLIPAALAEGETELTINVGEKLALDLSTYTNSGKAAFSTSDRKIASVSKRGVVEGVGQGQAVITAFYKTTGETALFNVTVNPKPFVKLNMRKATLLLGSTAQNTVGLEAECYPETLAQELVWTSSRPTVAVVLGDGTVIANGRGSTVITAATADGKYKASCSVTVKTVGVARYAGSAAIYGYSIGQTIDTEALMSHEGVYAKKVKKNTEYIAWFTKGATSGYSVWTVNSKKKLVNYTECVWSTNYNTASSWFDTYYNDAYAACGKPQATYMTFLNPGNGGTAELTEAVRAGRADERLMREFGMQLNFEWSYKKGMVDAAMLFDGTDGAYVAAIELH